MWKPELSHEHVAAVLTPQDLSASQLARFHYLPEKHYNNKNLSTYAVHIFIFIRFDVL
jgi:hypothetical protein